MENLAPYLPIFTCCRLSAGADFSILKPWNLRNVAAMVAGVLISASSGRVKETLRAANRQSNLLVPLAQSLPLLRDSLAEVVGRCFLARSIHELVYSAIVGIFTFIFTYCIFCI